jgi:hypothetical protein
VLVGGVWIGTGVLIAGGQGGIAVVMGLVSIALAALALILRFRQPVAYAVGEDGLVVVRRRGALRLPGALRSARARPFEGRDLRLLGSGGIYGYLGRFRLTGIGGGVRSYVTDGRHAVLVAVDDQKVLVSPRDEAGFITAAGGTDA